VRWNILVLKRIDARSRHGRPIVVEGGFLPRTHGSALFTEARLSIVVATLAPAKTNSGSTRCRERTKKRMRITTFRRSRARPADRPPACEIGMASSLARDPSDAASKEEFPTPSGGVGDHRIEWLLSMATVCGTSLALMERRAAEAATAVLAMASSWRQTLPFFRISATRTFGDMDFKVAGREGSPLQMDIKIAHHRRS